MTLIKTNKVVSEKESIDMSGRQGIYYVKLFNENGIDLCTKKIIIIN